ncbi:hypothetical protein [Amycolatopsis dendrobii]|uniref:Uncharacterized protein n=1 Tax=Amycolatopsis dendrobii TaxID=2760662 RepID=A0A7W3Z9T0_9PSEU|nr:hypothetical protein [Amycolatopsis dendrobii]MBB1153495.1 hypothetical protein [Amycolatopsis dendrobii]
MIGKCRTCGHPVYRDCEGDILHADYAEVFTRDHGEHLPEATVVVMQWWADVDGGSPAYGEPDADRVDIFTEAGDYVATLYRAESSSRWTDVLPADVTRVTILWRDVDTYVSDPDGANLV